jgi:hypothetical protein
MNTAFLGIMRLAAAAQRKGAKNITRLAEEFPAGPPVEATAQRRSNPPDTPYLLFGGRQVFQT